MNSIDLHCPQLVLTTKEAARVLKLSHRTLEDWRLSGQGPKFRKWGRMVRYHVADIQAFIDTQSFSNTAQALAA